MADLLNNTGTRHVMAGAARRYALARRWDTAFEVAYQSYRDAGDARAPREAMHHAA